MFSPSDHITCVSPRTHPSSLFTTIRPGPQQGLHETRWWMDDCWFRAGLHKCFSAKIQIVNIFGFGGHTATLLSWGGKQPLAIRKQIVWLCADKMIQTNGRRAGSLEFARPCLRIVLSRGTLSDDWMLCVCAVQYGSHCPHVEHLECGQCNWELDF